MKFLQQISGKVGEPAMHVELRLTMRSWPELSRRVHNGIEAYDRPRIAEISSEGLLSANLNHNRAHPFAAGILPMCLLDLIKPEGVFDRHGDPSVFEPFKKLLQI